MNMKSTPSREPRMHLALKPDFSASRRYVAYRTASFSCALKAVAFLTELKTSSANVPPSAYCAREIFCHLTMNLPTIPMVRTIATTVLDRIRVSFQYLMKPTTKAETKVASAVKVSPTFSLIPSWIKFVSAVIRVVISPAPSLSK